MALNVILSRFFAFILFITYSQSFKLISNTARIVPCRPDSYLSPYTGSISTSASSWRLFQSDSSENGDDTEIGEIQKSLGSEVNFVMSEILKTIQGTAQSLDGTVIPENQLSSDTIDASFAKILTDIRSSDTLSNTQKKFLYAEAALTIEDAKSGDDNVISSVKADKSKTNKLVFPKVVTSLYSEQNSPYVIVHGPGPVGQSLYDFTNRLGDRANFKFIDADQLNVIQDSELAFAVRGAKSVIIACDKASPIGGRGGLFGGGGDDEDFVVDERGLKRLLNAISTARKKSSDSYPVKVVVMDRATIQKKSFASMLGGSTFELGNNAILQCKARNLNYAIVKVGKVIDDDMVFPSNERLRPEKIDVSSNKMSRDIPFVFTQSRVEASEVTKTTTAVDALLRSASHPQTNSTISVVSIDAVDREVTDEEWDDEFLRIEGPELKRVPLYYSTSLQMGIKIGRVAQELQQPGSGLITPIEVERYANGVRLVFRPMQDSYKSSKEEKDEEKQKDADINSSTIENKEVPKSSYVRPELDINFNPGLEEKEEEKKKKVAPKSKKVKPEGGLEIIVDDAPYRRVRIRRCNMGPETIVKEASEALILKAILIAIKQLESFYEKMINDPDLDNL